jgi:hypothetical protein
MASGDGTATRTLRAERDALETDLRDLDAALRVAGDRIETAARDLARAEYPLAEESLHDLVARFNAVVDAAHELARELRAAQPEVSSRWARAGFSEAEPSARPEHPAKAVPAALSPLARVVVRAIGDLT